MRSRTIPVGIAAGLLLRGGEPGRLEEGGEVVLGDVLAEQLMQEGVGPLNVRVRHAQLFEGSSRRRAPQASASGPAARVTRASG
jgi:hypothetical protein